MPTKVVEYEVGAEGVVAGTRTQGQRVVEGGAEGMPVRVRVMGVSEAGSSVPIAPAATVAPGGFMFSTPLQNLLTQNVSCPEFSGDSEQWDSWLRRWKEFMRTFCSMGTESEQVMSKVLMMKVDKATRVRWSMREEEGEVLTYAGMMEDLEVSFGANTRGSKRRLWDALKLTLQGGHLTRSVWELFICEFERLGRELGATEEDKVERLIQALPPSIGGFVSRARNRKYKVIIDGASRGTTTPEIRWIVKGVGVPNKCDPRTGGGWLLVWDMLEEKNRCLRLDGVGFDFENGRANISVKQVEFGLEEAKRVVRKEVEQLESNDTSYKRGKVKDRGTCDIGESTYEDTEVVQVRALQVGDATSNFQQGGGGFRGGASKEGGGGKGRTWQPTPNVQTQVQAGQQQRQQGQQGWKRSQSSNQPQRFQTAT